MCTKVYTSYDMCPESLFVENLIAYGFDLDEMSKRLKSLPTGAFFTVAMVLRKGHLKKW